MEVFLAACDEPAAPRGAVLDRECTDDAELREAAERMLAADARAEPAAVARFPGGQRRFGPYHLVSELGSGGMGSVFLAELRQDAIGLPKGSRVALKASSPSP